MGKNYQNNNILKYGLFIFLYLIKKLIITPAHFFWIFCAEANDLFEAAEGVQVQVFQTFIYTPKGTIDRSRYEFQYPEGTPLTKKHSGSTKNHKIIRPLPFTSEEPVALKLLPGEKIYILIRPEDVWFKKEQFPTRSTYKKLEAFVTQSTSFMELNSDQIADIQVKPNSVLSLTLNQGKVELVNEKKRMSITSEVASIFLLNTNNIVILSQRHFQTQSKRQLKGFYTQTLL